MKPDDPRHGTMTGYTSGKCRCSLCKAAAKAYRKEFRQGHMESVRLAEQAYYKQHAPAYIKATKANQTKRLKELQANPEDPRHGTITSYNAGCRCDKCIDAGKKQRAKWRARVLAELKANKDDPRHGSLTGYTAGCRCFKCRLTNSERRKKK